MIINILQNLFEATCDSKQSQVETVITPAIEKSVTENIRIIPEKFRSDVEALNKYISPEVIDGKKHVEINVSLNELLTIIPKLRKKSDAFTPLIRFLGDEMNTTLNIIKKVKKD